MNIVIFHRKSDEAKVRRFCIALVTSATNSELTFETQEYIPPAIGVTYYVKVEEKEGQPAKFRAIDVGNNPATKPPYIYKVELLEEWSGFVEDGNGNEEADKSS